MADVKLLKYDGTEQQYRGVERVQLAKVDGGTAIFSEGEAVEGIEISPDFSSGDMPVIAPTGTLVKSAVIKQPETLVPENIRRGVMVAGIEGDLIGDTEERTVALSMSDGDQIILPTQDGKVISKVTVAKPETLVPENILVGVEIGGVTGELDPPDPVETEIDLDFSNGAMEVVPLDGKVFSKVSIPVPKNLVAENIAEGVDVAGIIGKHSGGANIKVASGTFTGNGGPVTVTHGLGVAPDIVLVMCLTGSTSSETAYILDTAYGLSQNFNKKSGWGYGLRGFKRKYSTLEKFSFSAIDTTANNCAINTTTEKTMIVGSNVGGTAPTKSGGSYKWLAIGGLT